MMKWTKRAAFALLAAALVVLAGCSGQTASGGQEGEGSQAGGEEKVLNIYTWADYFPADVVAQFTEDTGIQVNYSTFESNEEMLMKLQAAQGGQYDLVLASDYIIEIAGKEGLLGKLDKEKIPNFANIDPAFQGYFYDPTNEYTVPYAAGIPLLIYNPAMTDLEITRYADLWDPSLADSVVVMDDARNIIGITLKTMGESFNVTDPEILNQAKEKLMQLKPNIRALDYSTSYNMIIGGEVAAGYMFTSQAATAILANPELKVAFAEEGLGFGIDSCFVPVNAPHPDSAYAFLDYILDGERSAYISSQTLYINCNAAARPYIENEALTITAEQIAGAEFIRDVGDATELYNDIWNEFKS